MGYQDIWAYEMPNGFTYIGRKQGKPPLTFNEVITVMTAQTPVKQGGNVVEFYRKAYELIMNASDGEKAKLPRFTIVSGSNVLAFINLEKAIASYSLESARRDAQTPSSQ